MKKIAYCVLLVFFWCLAQASFASISAHAGPAEESESEAKAPIKKEDDALDGVAKSYDEASKKINAGISDFFDNSAVKVFTGGIKSVFLGPTPSFHGHNYLFQLGGAGSITHGDQAGMFTMSASIPLRLLINGRTSIEVGVFSGELASQLPESLAGDITFIMGGVMHEFMADFKYFYVTLGVGLIMRNVDNTANPIDRIGSQIVFAEKIAIGKSFFDRFNIELYFRHMSNANITKVNGGYNMIGTSISISI